jgi:hypothetical protein
MLQSVFDRLQRNVKRQVTGTGGARKSPYQRYQLNAQEIAGRKRSWRQSAPVRLAALTPGGCQIGYMGTIQGCTHSRGVSDWCSMDRLSSIGVFDCKMTTR